MHHSASASVPLMYCLYWGCLIEMGGCEVCRKIWQKCHLYSRSACFLLMISTILYDGSHYERLYYLVDPIIAIPFLQPGKFSHFNEKKQKAIKIKTKTGQFFVDVQSTQTWLKYHQSEHLKTIEVKRSKLKRKTQFDNLMT